MPMLYPLSCVSPMSVLPPAAHLVQGCVALPSPKPSHGQQMAQLLDCTGALLGPSSKTTVSLFPGAPLGDTGLPGMPRAVPCHVRLLFGHWHCFCTRQGREMWEAEAPCKGAPRTEVPWCGLCLETRKPSPLWAWVSLLCSSPPS